MTRVIERTWTLSGGRQTVACTAVDADTTPAELAAAVAAHEADTTNVHGLANGAAMATDAELASAVAAIGLELAGLGSMVGYGPLGEATFGRMLGVTAGATTSGQFRAGCFTARKSFTATKVRLYLGTGAGATPTIARIGLYTVSGIDTLTQVAATPNDTALLAVSNAPVEKNLSSPYAVVAGTRYALGLVFVTGASTPTLICNTATLNVASIQAPRTSVLVTGQTDLPASVVVASMSTASNYVPLIELLP